MNGMDRLDPIEASLAELDAAEQAGLFRRTRVDARALLRSAPAVTRARSGFAAWRRLSIAAVLAIAATISGWLFSSRSVDVGRHSLPSVSATASATDGCDGTFYRCLSGPSGMAAGGCAAYDYNADGHVDLVDASTYQLTCNGITR
jgi:hypothetical protein